MIEYRKAFGSYIQDCKDPDRKAAAEKVMDSIKTRRKYKAEIIDNPDGMKLQEGKLYRIGEKIYRMELVEIKEPDADREKRQSGEAIMKPKHTEMKKLERELKKCQIRQHLNKINPDPDYDEEANQKQAMDIVVQLATLQAGGSIKRSADGRLIEIR